MDDEDTRNDGQKLADLVEALRREGVDFDLQYDNEGQAIIYTGLRP